MRLTPAEVAGFAVKMYGGTGQEPFPSDLVREIERAVVEKWAAYFDERAKQGTIAFQTATLERERHFYAGWSQALEGRAQEMRREMRASLEEKESPDGE